MAAFKADSSGGRDGWPFMASWRAQLAVRPLAFFAVAALGGIVVADWLPDIPRGFMTAAVLAALLGGAAGWTRRSAAGPLMLTASALGFLHWQTLEETRHHPVRAFLQGEPSLGIAVEARGRIDKALRRDLPGTEPREEYFEAWEVTAPTRGLRWQGRTVLRLITGRQTALPAGEYQVAGTLRLPRPRDNPGQFDEQSYDLRLGLVAELRAHRVQCLREDRFNLSSTLNRWAENCRQWMVRALRADLEDAPVESAVIAAMALGAVDGAGRDLQTPFRLSGTLHIFAVSGLHVAIVGLVFWMFLKALGVRRTVLLAILIPILFGYAFVTGLRPSAMRAAVMSSVFLCAALVHRKPDLLNSLGAAALILLVFDTNQAFAPGFQLSFAVLAAIAVLNHRFASPFQRFVEPDPFLPRPLLSAWQRAAWKGRREAVGLFTVSAAAWVGSLPFTLVYFHLATPVSLLANVVLVPLSFLVLFTAIVTLMSAAAQCSLLQVLFSNAGFAAAWLTMRAAVFFAGLPGAWFYVPDLLPGAAPSVELTVLRMPEGAGAQYLRAGDRHWLLDVGGASDIDYVLRPCLRQRGVNRLAGMVLSHGDYEHAGAAAALLREYQDPPLYHASTEPWRRESRRSTFQQLWSQGVAGRPLSLAERLDFDPGGSCPATALVLYPPAEILARRADDRALVLRLDLGGHRVIWCNDAGFLAEKAILERFSTGDLRAEVLVRNQHATDFSLLPEFLDAVRPRLVIASHSSFPVEEVLSRRVRQLCEERGVVLLDQAVTGAVSLKVWPHFLEVEAFRGKQSGFRLIPVE